MVKYSKCGILVQTEMFYGQLNVFLVLKYNNVSPSPQPYRRFTVLGILSSHLFTSCLSSKKVIFLPLPSHHTTLCATCPLPHLENIFLIPLKLPGLWKISLFNLKYLENLQNKINDHRPWGQRWRDDRGALKGWKTEVTRPEKKVIRWWWQMYGQWAELVVEGVIKM